MTDKHEIYVAKSEHYRKSIVVDLDGVVADFCFSYTQYLSKKYGKPEYPMGTYDVTPGDLTDLGFERSHKEEFWEWCYNQDSFWLNLREMEPGIVKRLYDSVYRWDKTFTVYFCTTREDGWRIPVQEESVGWLVKHGWKHNPNVVVSERKGDFCYSVNATYFIDDKFDNCKQVCEKSPTTKVFWLALPAQRHYMGEAMKYDMKVINHLDQFIDFIADQDSRVSWTNESKSTLKTG